MESYIDLFIKDLLSKKNNWSEDCVVFPSRRAGLIFKKKISDHITEPVFLPAVYAIDDFISKLSPCQTVSSAHLLCELYTVYKNHFNNTDFETYMPWGEILLKDFNDVDMHLAQAEKLYAQVLSLKEIDQLIGVNEEETERIRAFWKLFSNQEISRLKSAFLDNWSKLPVIYNEFKQQLIRKNMAFSGMASRMVAEGLKAGNISVPWERIHFSGFYALSNSEKSIFNFLSDSNKATVYWDADHYYLDDTNQEAGKYLRKKQLNSQSKELHMTFDYFKNEDRSVHIVGVPHHIGQAKFLGTLLAKDHHQLISYDQTAVVLPDEKLLMPVLYSLPQKTGSINVTMGYPLQGTMLEQLVRDLKTLCTQMKKDRNETAFIKQDVLTLLENNFLYRLDPTGVTALIRHIKNEKKYFLNTLFFDEQEVLPELKVVFTELANMQEPITGLPKVLYIMLSCFSKNKNSISKLDFSILKFYYEELVTLAKLITLYKPYIDFHDETNWKLILELLKSMRIPFTGEPVKGLQIMGFLETRNLDFENLYILSVNETVMPGSQAGQSYIPYSIRKAYGLPTFEDQDAIYAYHFFRLLQRSKNIYLFYSTESGGTSGGEMSRYILQIAYELKKKYPERIHLTHQLVGTNMVAEAIHEISIKKEGHVLERLNQLFFSSDPQRKKWSATAFTTYINCPLQFYFKYLAGIKEPDEIKDEIDPAVFGNIIHFVMESFYKNKTSISGTCIENLKPLVEQEVETNIRSLFPSPAGNLTGKNSLLKTVIIDLISKILTQDQKETPFNIIGLETTYAMELEIADAMVSVYGKIDRLDEKGGIIRIIDYKTGKDTLPKILKVDSLFQDISRKATFQLLFYAMLYKHLVPESKIIAGIYSMRAFSGGISFLNEGAEVSDDQIAEFKEKLTGLITEITNPHIDFSQTNDPKRCRFCAYKEICNR